MYAYGQTDAPEGTFTAIATGGIHSCAIRTDETITCWEDIFSVKDELI